MSRLNAPSSTVLAPLACPPGSPRSGSLILMALGLILAGCPNDPASAGDSGPSVDAGVVTADAGSLDAGSLDAGSLDAGSLDAGSEGGDGGVADDGGVEPAMPLTARRAADEMGYGFNLGRVFEDTELATPRSIEVIKAKIDAYYAMGFRNVRIPITWTEEVFGSLLVHDPLVGDVDRSHPRLAMIAEVVDYALSLPGLYVVINAHHERGLKQHVRDAAFERLWGDIADIFADRDHRLMFELLNEPRSNSTAMRPEDLRRMTGLAYDAVRAEDPERVVIIGGNDVFAASEMRNVWTGLDEVGGGDDPFVMATFHHYSPWSFCGSNQGSYDDPWTPENISSPMDTMTRWADELGGGMPVYIGEWGVGWQSRYPTTMACNNIRLWYSEFVQNHAAPRGQPTAVWDDGGWFRIFSYSSGGFDNNLTDCILGACEWDGTGRYDDVCD